MNITFTSKTTAECQEYLSVLYENTKYSLIEFAEKFKTGDFSLDVRLKDCTIIYRGKIMTYDELGKENYNFGEELKFLERYSTEIYPLEHFLLVSNRDYYKAAKYINKVEKCLQTARYYLMSSHNLIKTDFDINWNAGYGPQFLLRTMDFTTAVVWYNSCFDYVLQTVYFAFGIYQKADGYTEQTSHETLLKKCTYYSLGQIYSKYKNVKNYKALWEIINKCYNTLSDVNGWANYIKHKGGIAFEGLNPQDPFQMRMTDKFGNIIAESTDFESIKIDMDSKLNILKEAHIALYDCVNEVVDFIDFASAVPQKDPLENVLLIPDKANYVKIILP